MMKMFDHETLWAVCLAERDDRLRRAAADRLADQLPPERSGLRAHVSLWLHALATRIDPTVEVLQPGMLGAR